MCHKKPEVCARCGMISITFCLPHHLEQFFVYCSFIYRRLSVEWYHNDSGADSGCYLFFPAGPLYVIVEFAANGNLRDFLKQRRPKPVVIGHYQNDEFHGPLPYKQLLSFSYQIARGMEYLASMKVPHQISFFMIS